MTHWTLWQDNRPLALDGLDDFVIVGSHATCDVRIAGPEVAARHVRLRCEGDGVAIENLAGRAVQFAGAAVIRSQVTVSGRLVVGGAELELVRSEAHAAPEPVAAPLPSTPASSTSDDDDAPTVKRPKAIKVMLIDDDPMILQVTAAVLRQAGYVVVVRDRALGSATEILRERPRVILLDLSLPALSGPSLVRFLHEQTSTAVVNLVTIFYSVREQRELDALAREHGVAGAIQKTSDHAAFLAAFRRILARQGLAA